VKNEMTKTKEKIKKKKKKKKITRMKLSSASLIKFFLLFLTD